jgi:hypothetical protein
MGRQGGSSPKEDTAMAVDRNLIQALAEANGLTIPEERLDVVLRQYQSFLRTLERIDSVPLPKETEPAITYTLAENGSMPGGR